MHGGALRTRLLHSSRGSAKPLFSCAYVIAIMPAGRAKIKSALLRQDALRRKGEPAANDAVEHPDACDEPQGEREGDPNHGDEENAASHSSANQKVRICQAKWESSQVARTSERFT